MQQKPWFICIFILVLLNIQFLAVTPSIPKSTTQFVSSAPVSKQSSISHAVLNTTTVNGTIVDWNSIITPDYYLHFGDILMVNMTTIALDDPGSGVIVYLDKPLASVAITKEVQKYSTVFFPAIGTNSEGNYSFKFYNPGRLQGGDRIEVIANITMISNSAPTLTFTQNQYIDKNFNFYSWYPADLNNDSITYDLSYSKGAGYDTIVTNTTNPNKFLKPVLENDFYDMSYTIGVTIHDYFSILNMSFSTYSSYGININFDKNAPQITEYPKNITIDPGKTDAQLTWNANDMFPNFYQVFKNNTLVNTSNWHLSSQHTYSLGKLDIGTYNYTFVIYNMVNDSTSVTAIVTVKTKSNGINGFEFLSIFAVPVLIFLKRKRKVH